jgi:stress response protein YsnF
MATTVIGLYDRFQDAQDAASALVSAGFRRENISVVAADTEGKFKKYVGEDVKEGAATGAGIGAVIGGLGGLLVGVGALAIPGIGPVLAAGPIAAALAGAGVGAATGGLIGALVDAGIPEEEANLYAEGVRRGGTMVTVTTREEHADEAVQIMNRFHPVDIDERARMWRSEKWNRFDPKGQPYTQSDFERERKRYTTDTRREGGKLEVVEEELRVGKREVDRERLRIHTYISERPVDETVELRKEHIEVQRRKVDRPATEADLTHREEETYEVTASSEEPVVQKRARVVEEVDVHKNVEMEKRIIHDKLRRKDVDIEHLDADDRAVYDEFDPMFRSHYETTYSQMGRSYNDLRPAYFYGYDMARNPQYKNRDWKQVESDARRSWEREYKDTRWDDIKQAVREGWMRATRQR